VVELTLYAPEEGVANEAAKAAFARIEELNRILSDYQSDSEAMRLCRTAGHGETVRVSRELFEVLEKSTSLSAQTDGAFDSTVGPLVKLWRTARRQRKLPNAEQLAAARILVDWRSVHLDADKRTVELRAAGTLLDFGGIAKGYIAEEARAVLRGRGIRQCLVAVAGDIAAGDPPPDSDGWKIGLAPLDKPDGPPSRLLRLVNCSISTSGDAFQFVEIEGVRYSHIVDPKTGLGLTRRSSVTVIAPDGASADGLATAVSVLGPDKGLKLISGTKGTAALIVLATDDGKTRVLESAEFSTFVISPDTAKDKPIRSELGP
jgi:FAD:protein FMN transferase